MVRAYIDPALKCRKTYLALLRRMMAAGLLDVPNVRDMFDRASQILDYDLLRLCLEGPEDRDRFMIQPAPSPNTW